MTHSAPSSDFYDDGLVHSHDWARNTPPGGQHGERGRGGHQHSKASHDHEEGLMNDHRWARS
jgi:hypothetical protein